MKNRVLSLVAALGLTACQTTSNSVSQPTIETQSTAQPACENAYVNDCFTSKYAGRIAALLNKDEDVLIDQGLDYHGHPYEAYGISDDFNDDGRYDVKYTVKIKMQDDVITLTLVDYDLNNILDTVDYMSKGIYCNPEMSGPAKELYYELTSVMEGKIGGWNEPSGIPYTAYLFTDPFLFRCEFINRFSD